jgi:lipocalin
MPYEVVKIGKNYAVKTTAGPNKNKLHGLTTKPKAEAQMRLLTMLMSKKMGK